MFNLLPDNPETSDYLGFQRMADILVQVIEDTPPPFTVGVFGEWGCGKTTLMTLVSRSLEQRGHRTVWFNAWKYDGKEVIWNALIQAIFYRMRTDPRVQRNSDLLDRVKTVAGRLALYAAKAATRFVPGDIVRESDVDGVVHALAPLSANDEEFEFINQFEATFDSLVRDYVGVEGKLIVLIDDLDRCLPENAIEVLESMKLYLDRANVTFVLGAERAIIEEGIRQRYQDNVRLSAKEYLEKIVQLPFVMRGLSPDRALDLIAPYAKTTTYRDDQTMRDLIVAGTGCNPRRIKRFINTYYVISEMSRRAGQPLADAETHRLALVLLVQMRFPEVYDFMVREPGLIDEFHRMLEMNSDQRETVMQRRGTLRHMYEDLHARRFFESVRAVDCTRQSMEPWVLLTKGG